LFFIISQTLVHLYRGQYRRIRAKVVNCSILSKHPSHKFSIQSIKTRNIIKNVTPEVIVVPLVYDLTLFIQHDPAGTVHDRRTGIPVQDGHLPFHIDEPVLHDRMFYGHGKLAGSPGEPFGQFRKGLNALHFLNAIPKVNGFIIIGYYMGPVGLSLPIIGLALELGKLFNAADHEGVWGALFIHEKEYNRETGNLQ